MQMEVFGPSTNTFPRLEDLFFVKNLEKRYLPENQNIGTFRDRTGSTKKTARKSIPLKFPFVL